MADAERMELRVAIAEIDAAKTMFEEALKPLSKGLQRLETVRGEMLALSISQQEVPTIKPTEHRRAHKFGRPAKIDVDPELEAFLLARVDRMTFDEMADDVAAHFPPKRRVGKSSIHLWWSKRKG